MADVSGHGVSAGMFMSSLQTAFHTLVPLSDSPLDVLERINHLYAHNINFTTFVTIFFGRLDPDTLQFSYGSAGHNSGYLYRPQRAGAPSPPDGSSHRLDGRIQRATGSRLSLSPGDMLVLYTDGVTEAMNIRNIQWSLDGLAEVVRSNNQLPPEQLIQKIMQTVSSPYGWHPAC